MVYSEGCPTHPAYPAGHAAIAGACATALKAFFNESFVIPNPMMANPDGLSLVPYKTDRSNVLLGRNVLNRFVITLDGKNLTFELSNP